MINYNKIYTDCKSKIVEELIEYLNRNYNGKLLRDCYINTKEYDDDNDIDYLRFICIRSLEVNNNDIEVTYEAGGATLKDSLIMFSLDEIYCLLRELSGYELCGQSGSLS